MGKDFISIADFSSQELQGLLDHAIRLKDEWRAGGNQPYLKNKVLAMIFEKPSLRTRVSFDMAMRQAGGDALYLSPNEIGLGKRESIADIARVLSGYVQAIMARVFDHQHILQLAHWADVPVINGLSDAEHPCQALADALTIYEKFGRLKSINVAYVGDGNNVAVSLMQICTKLGANFSIASPQGYEIHAETVKQSQVFADAIGSKVSLYRDPIDAVRSADVIYTDTWTSMGQEEEALIRQKIFPPYQVNTHLLSHARPDAIVLHCLPAHRGQEITDEVADGPHSAIFAQAANRLHAQKAILVELL